MKNLVFKTFAILVINFFSINAKAQSTDFTMFFNVYCASVTIEVYSATNTLLWSGAPFFGKVCITGGIPDNITIVDGTCNSFNFPINGTFISLPAPPNPQCGCIFYTPNYPPNTFGFFAQYNSTGGTCASPSGLLALTLYPNL